MRNNKTLAIILAAAMVFALCACGTSPAGTKTVTEAPPVSVAGSTSTPEPEVAEPEETFSVGATTNNTYVNEYFGIGVSLDENWAFSTQEEIEELNGVSIEAVNDDDYQKALENGTVYTDMMAYADDGIANMNVTIEKLNVVSGLALDENGYIDAALNNNDFEAVFASAGITVTTLESSSVVLAGSEHPCIILEGDAGGIGLFEKMVPVKVGNYVLLITVASVGENVTDALLGYFYAV